MTWGWNARGPMAAASTGQSLTHEQQGGSLDNSTQAWPRYEAQYLKRRLQETNVEKKGRYDDGGFSDGVATDDVKRQIYLDKVTENYELEADECLKSEFKLWLQGQHETNSWAEIQRKYDASTAPLDLPKGVTKDNLKLMSTVYKNLPGELQRRRTFRKDGENWLPGDAWDDWRHTSWGAASLTHLPGVRDFLRAEKIAAEKTDLRMNLLADHGPQDLEQAWLYFKHWVKRKPVTEADCNVGLQPLYEPRRALADTTNHLHGFSTRKQEKGDSSSAQGNSSSVSPLAGLFSSEPESPLAQLYTSQANKMQQEQRRASLASMAGRGNIDFSAASRTPGPVGNDLDLQIQKAREFERKSHEDFANFLANFRTEDQINSPLRRLPPTPAEIAAAELTEEQVWPELTEEEAVGTTPTKILGFPDDVVLTPSDAARTEPYAARTDPSRPGLLAPFSGGFNPQTDPIKGPSEIGVPTTTEELQRGRGGKSPRRLSDSPKSMSSEFSRRMKEDLAVLNTRVGEYINFSA